jgi:hypothetical protein
MRKPHYLALMTTLTPALLLALPVAAQGFEEAVLKPLGQRVASACEPELARYCATVTPGEGRLLACLFAHEDKLSGRCEYALYDTSAQLERAIVAITHVASACEADITGHCAKVETGEGRIAQCLKAAGDKISQSCRQAMQDTGLK